MYLIIIIIIINVKLPLFLSNRGGKLSAECPSWSGIYGEETSHLHLLRIELRSSGPESVAVPTELSTIIIVIII
jgi:hypothetical protein